MYKIISIKAKYRSDKYYIDFGNEVQLEITSDLVLKYKLNIGKEIEEKELKNIKDDQNLINAKQAGYNFVAYKPRSENQVKKKLAQKGFDADIIIKAIDFLYEFKMLDDEKYAKSYVNDYLRKKPSSKNKLTQELRSKGISIDIIQKTLIESEIEDSELENAKESARRKFKKISYKPKEKHYNYLQSHLIREGFRYEIIKIVLGEMFKER